MSEDADLKQTALTLFQGLSSSYDKVLDNVTLKQDRYWKKFLIGKANLRRGERILDLGCGTCVLEEKLLPIGCDVIGLDLSEQMVRRGLRKRIQSVSTLLQADAENLPFSDSSFEVVLSCYLAKYCDARRLVGEIGRVLSAGGRMIVYDFSRPRGTLGPFHAFYVYGVLKILSGISRMAIRKLETTFVRLPGIIRRTNWVESWRRRLEEHEFEQVGEKALTGGVVTVFWATRANP